MRWQIIPLLVSNCSWIVFPSRSCYLFEVILESVYNMSIAPEMKNTTSVQFSIKGYVPVQIKK